ncbi:MAG TPA: hypothetical protein VJL89_08410, partial [Thermodesulfovibrionia bacterium]|nr:hypothetical protein [Thermodesulfovibrionia bacterium]
MAKKRKNKAKKDKQSLQIKSPQLLLKEGQAYLEKGYFKEAIHSFKELLKREDRQQWRDLLIQAYTERAKELLQKDMPNEAFVIVQQIESINKGEKNIPLYIGVLLGAGQYKEAASYFLDHQNGSSLESIFGSLVLTGNKDVIGAIPKSHPLSLHRHIVLEAIEALSQGNDELCKDLLNKISFRSPYRDWRFFLRGLMAYYNGSGEEAVEYFNKTSQDIVLKSLLTGSILQQIAKVDKKLSSINQKDMFFLISLHGLDTKAFHVFEQLKALFHKEQFGSVFPLLKNNAHFFDKHICLHLCKSLLIKDLRQKPQYEAAYGMLTPFERLRITALFHEHKQDYHEANRHWRQCMNTIFEDVNKSENEKNLAVSLIFKRMADNKKHDRPSSHYELDDWKTSILEYLESSVKFDPYDRISYDEIIHYYAYTDRKKEAQTWIDTLVERFPEDIPALFMSSDSALDRKAYKKAIGFLDRILQIDPVNKDAKAKKVFIHITKARKNIDEKKFHLARKEFEAAAECSKKNTDEYGGVLIKWGCMELLTENTRKGDALVHEGLTLTGQGLRALYFIVVESKRMGLASSVYKKYTRLFEEQLNLPVTEDK